MIEESLFTFLKKIFKEIFKLGLGDFPDFNN